MMSMFKGMVIKDLRTLALEAALMWRDDGGHYIHSTTMKELWLDTDSEWKAALSADAGAVWLRVRGVSTFPTSAVYVLMRVHGLELVPESWGEGASVRAFHIPLTRTMFRACGCWWTLTYPSAELVYVYDRSYPDLANALHVRAKVEGDEVLVRAPEDDVPVYTASGGNGGRALFEGVGGRSVLPVGSGGDYA